MSSAKAPNRRRGGDAAQHVALPFLLLVSGLTTCYSSMANTDCAKLDEGLTACPAPQPRMTYRFIEGYVVLAYTVREDGAVEDIEVVESMPPGLHDQAAIAALRLWRYQPSGSVTRKRRTFTFRLAE
ncbi:MAG TPA: energy transducer TonB [Gammaproteobacteria bacterium]